MSGFRLVGLMPTYREGSLARSAVDSLLQARLDKVIVWEGPAGDGRVDDDAPPTMLDLIGGHSTYFATTAPLFDFKAGRWESDAAKRTEMLRYAVKQYPGEIVWGIWLDGDELLVNGRYLRDLVQERAWNDEHEGANLRDPSNLPTGGIPVRLVEYDGTCSFAHGRLIRLDTVRRFVVSNLLIETVLGSEMRLGNVPERTELEDLAREAFPGRRIVPPPLPGEPVIVHRSHLRHPARKGLRLHEQEKAELERLGIPT